MSSCIIVEAVTRCYGPGTPPAVDSLSLSVQEGEILALLGPSGCGKTTTLRLIMGFEAPDAGWIQIGDRVVAGRGQMIPPEARGIGMVFQDYALFPHLTVSHNVAFGLRHLPASQRTHDALRTLRLCELEEFAQRYPHELSGGQKQRVALARALAPGFPIILLDEPLASLDADLRTQLSGQVRRLLKEAARTAILVTHDQSEAFRIADRVGILNRGRLEQIGTPEEIYHTPATRFVATFVGEADFLPGTVQADGIHTEVGVFPNGHAFPAGAHVDVLVRPEEIGLVADPHGSALVTERRFRGSNVLYRVRLPSGRHLHSYQPPTRDLRAGAPVSLRAAPARVAAFPATMPEP